MKFYHVFVLIFFVCSCKNEKPQSMAPQNPSPMEEHIRPHTRISTDSLPGERIIIDSLLSKKINLFIPEKVNSDSVSLLIHFHGMPYIMEYAVTQNEGFIGAAITLGGGSSTYGKPFNNDSIFSQVVQKIKLATGKHFNKVVLSGWSAGYGAIRSILRNDNKVDGIILLDGMHAGYIPEATTLHAGGKLDSTNIKEFIDYGKLAARGKGKFIFTHSTIFPGTYASTTECADYIINELQLSRKPVLKEGPLGMQQVGETKEGNLAIIAFTGNTAPDHIDHLHGLYDFLKSLLK